MRRTPFTAALVLTSALALAACSSNSGGSGGSGDGDSAASVPTISAAPATGETVSGDGYSYNLPEGWAISDDPTLVGQADTLAYNPADADGFADNVNVLLTPSGEVTPDQVETQGVQEFKDSGSTDVVVDDRVTIAGSESAHLSGPLTNAGASYFIEQYYPSHDSQTYVVTFSFSDTTSEADRATVTDAVLASWQWS
jgi:hypothetical protein